jgi:hypothetical protein
MQRISHPYPTTIKIGPYVVFGLLGLLLVLLLWSGAYETSPMLLIAVGGIGLYGVCAMASSQRDCMDDVFDCGDHLLVRKNGEEDTVPFSNIVNVNFWKNPQNISARISLTLASPGKFGTEIVFAPPPQFYFSFPPRNKIAEDLLLRAEEARRGSMAKPGLTRS